jgi:ABC-2 type transport system ATP-binding protein
MAYTIVTEGLTKSFRALPVLTGLDLRVATGSVFALLGPNGAGKTTTVRILSTLLPADGGTASVAGFDVATRPREVRRAISLTGQYAAVDEILTGQENLRMMARLRHLGRTAARNRAAELLERFALTEARDRRVATYSGGMRRRLDIAISLISDPPVVFLDEPTTGLDPRSRRDVWESVAGLRDSGVTVLLTTQYLEEADRLADRIAVVDGGRVIAEGTADELKARVGGDVLDLRVADRTRIAAAAGAVLGLGPSGAQVDNASGEISIPAGNDGASVLTEAVRRLDAEGVVVADIALHRPTLDDVFLRLTGRSAEAVAEDDSKANREAPQDLAEGGGQR